MASAAGSAPSSDRRFPFPAYPTGWFRVAFAAEVGGGSGHPDRRPGPLPLSFFGRELVAFVDDDGGPRVLDAHCPHLGAHLGHGGRVEGDCVVCPFHGWRFDREGRNVEIPYRPGEVNARARLGAYPAREWAGLVMVWFDASGGEPAWELPTLPELDDPGLLWHAPTEARWRIRSHPQEILGSTRSTTSPRPWPGARAPSSTSGAGPPSSTPERCCRTRATMGVDG